MALAVLVAAAAGGLAYGMRPAPSEPIVVRSSPPTADTCRVVDLRDAGTGRPVRGAEDIAVDRAAGVAYVSAYDRHAVEAAVAANAPTLPQGGIYALRSADLADGADILHLPNLAAPFAAGRDFHPHGIGFRRLGDGGRLVAVNRHYGRRTDGAWHLTPSIEVFGTDGNALASRVTIEHPLICRPNDVAIAESGMLLVSNDRGACGWLGARLEDGLGLRRAYVAAVTVPDSPDGTPEVRTVAGDIGFANGVAVSADGGTLLVAATRERAVLAYDLGRLLDGGEPVPRRLGLDGHPDNITVGPDGEWLVATHASLLRLARHRYGWFGGGQAAARVVAVDPDGSAADVAYADPEAVRLSAVTVAASLDGYLILGAVADAGLVVCRFPTPAGGSAMEVRP